MTPDESLDVELTFLAEQLEMLRGISRDDFLAQPCKVIQMPRAEYRKVYGKPSDEDLKRLEESLLAHRARTTPPAFEECE
ncbi:hypothetical protein [Streptomyces thermocarboxydovorans]